MTITISIWWTISESTWCIKVPGAETKNKKRQAETTNQEVVKWTSQHRKSHQISKGLAVKKNRHERVSTGFQPNRLSWSVQLTELFNIVGPQNRLDFKRPISAQLKATKKGVWVRVTKVKYSSRVISKAAQRLRKGFRYKCLGKAQVGQGKK